MDQEEIQKIEQEQAEIDALLDKGVTFTVRGKTFQIHQFYLGTMDRLSDLYLKMVIDDEALKDSGTLEVNRIVKNSAKIWAKAVATAVLNRKSSNPVRMWLLTRFFLWNMTPGDLKKITELIMTMSNMVNFIISTRLIAGTRTTKPNPVEQNKQA